MSEQPTQLKIPSNIKVMRSPPIPSENADGDSPAAPKAIKTENMRPYLQKTQSSQAIELRDVVQLYVQPELHTLPAKIRIDTAVDNLIPQIRVNDFPLVIEGAAYLLGEGGDSGFSNLQSAANMPANESLRFFECMGDARPHLAAMLQPILFEIARASIKALKASTSHKYTLKYLSQYCDLRLSIARYTGSKVVLELVPEDRDGELKMYCRTDDPDTFALFVLTGEGEVIGVEVLTEEIYKGVGVKFVSLDDEEVLLDDEEVRLYNENRQLAPTSAVSAVEDEPQDEPEDSLKVEPKDEPEV